MLTALGNMISTMDQREVVAMEALVAVLPVDSTRTQLNCLSPIWTMESQKMISKSCLAILDHWNPLLCITIVLAVPWVSVWIFSFCGNGFDFVFFFLKEPLMLFSSVGLMLSRLSNSTMESHLMVVPWIYRWQILRYQHWEKSVQDLAPGPVQTQDLNKTDLDLLVSWLFVYF